MSLKEIIASGRCWYESHVCRYPGRQWCAKHSKYIGDRKQCHKKCGSFKSYLLGMRRDKR